MATGIKLAANPDAVNVVDDVIAQARCAYEHGVRQIWLAQQFDHDAIALAGLIGVAGQGRRRHTHPGVRGGDGTKSVAGHR
jgi:hypothetical protein